MRPPETEKPAPRLIGAGSKIDCLAANIDNPKHNTGYVEMQGINSYTTTQPTLPFATAQPLGGICHSLHVHHVGGAIEHRGLFHELSDAQRAASKLNALFQAERWAN